jgi:predicted PurR-regulated permease PerM
LKAKTEIVSHIAVVTLIVSVMLLKLMAGAIAGFLVYSISMRVKSALERRTPRLHARGLALALVITSVVLVLLIFALGVWQAAKGEHGVAGVSAELVDGLNRLHDTLPAALRPYLPAASLDDAKVAAVEFLHKYSADLSAMGMGTLRVSAHVLIGLIAGAMLAWSAFGDSSSYRPLSAALLRRFSALRDAFDRVVFAQVKISVLNTVLAALYLEVALPLFFGTHVPFSKSLIAFTFLAGLVPVAGNLASNAVIVLASLAVSYHAAVASLVYLILVHKLEYFANARIVGHNIEARAWEIIIAMVAMEALFGLPGVVVAPILYAYLKRELKEAGLIGRDDGQSLASPAAPRQRAVSASRTAESA